LPLLALIEEYITTFRREYNAFVILCGLNDCLFIGFAQDKFWAVDSGFEGRGDGGN